MTDLSGLPPEPPRRPLWARFGIGVLALVTIAVLAVVALLFFLIYRWTHAPGWL